MTHRVKGKFELTEAGSELHAIAQSHFRALDNLLRRDSGKTISVRVAGGESVLHGALLPVLPRLRGRFPDITLELFNCRSEETLARLKDGRVDFGLVLDESVDGDLEAHAIGNVRLGVFLPNDQHLKVSRPDAWKLIATMPIAALAESRAVSRVRRYAEERSIEAKTVFLGSSYAQVVDAAASLGCLALVPDFFVTTQKHGRFFALHPGGEFARTMSIAWKPRHLLLHPHGRTVSEELKELISKNLSGQSSP